MAKRHETALVWFRRDLRSYDHAALYHALKEAHRVHCVFVFDSEILDALTDLRDRRVEFIWLSLEELRQSLEQLGGGLQLLSGRAREVIPSLAARLGAQAVYANHDYEPQAKDRDEEVRRSLEKMQCALHTFKDQVIFEKDEILNKSDRPFTIFTPYKQAWLKKLNPFYFTAYPIDTYRDALVPGRGSGPSSLQQIGFLTTNLTHMQLPTGMSGARTLFKEFLQRIDGYRDRRNFPAIRGVSYLSVHLRFGTISIRELVRMAASTHSSGSETWISELIWRDFYFSILHHYPHVVGHAFNPAYEGLKFTNSGEKFAAWTEGRTGFPLVDSAMRQLNETGYMHNRLRMVTASFLVKDLHVDWRWGEAYFARKLNDFDLAANNGGWQWSASTGCDAQPWFRIFNPVVQSRRFDPDGTFIRMYVRELAGVDTRFIHEPWNMTADDQRTSGVRVGKDYPTPIVDHAAARKLTLQMYAAANPRNATDMTG